MKKGIKAKSEINKKERIHMKKDQFDETVKWFEKLIKDVPLCSVESNFKSKKIRIKRGSETFELFVVCGVVCRIENGEKTHIGRWVCRMAKHLEGKVFLLEHGRVVASSKPYSQIAEGFLYQIMFNSTSLTFYFHLCTHTINMQPSKGGTWVVRGVKQATHDNEQKFSKSVLRLSTKEESIQFIERYEACIRLTDRLCGYYYRTFKQVGIKARHYLGEIAEAYGRQKVNSVIFKCDLIEEGSELVMNYYCVINNVRTEEEVKHPFYTLDETSVVQSMKSVVQAVIKKERFIKRLG